MRDHVKWLREFARENTQGDVISAATATELADDFERLRTALSASNSHIKELEDRLLKANLPISDMNAALKLEA